MKRLIAITLILSLASALAFAQDKSGSKDEPFDRGIGMPNSCFIPKGAVGGGLSVAYSKYNLGNASEDVGFKMLFSMLQGIRGEMNSFGISPFLSYFVADNISIGLRFDYDKRGFGLENADLTLTDELGFNIKDVNYLKQSYRGAVTARDYIPIANSRRFAMFAELRLGGAYAQAESFKYVNNDKTGTYQDIYNFSVGLTPGITCFVTNETAIEVSIGVLGYEYQKIIQKTNQVEISQTENSSANFKINLMSINLGLSVYIPTGSRRMKHADKHKK